MVEEEKSVSVIDYLEIAWRRRWYIIIPFTLVMTITFTLCVTLPKIYKASTTILVIPQGVPDSFVKSTVTMNPSAYLNVISQEIMSRTRLEKVIHELSLFPEIINKVPMEKIIASMRANIEIDVHSNENRGVSSFTISYLDKDPQTVASTANRLASLFIEENLKSREQQAKKTTKFLEGELNKLNIVIEEQEKKISEFKQQHLGSLPDQREPNLRMMDQLILQRQSIIDELNDTENRKILLQQFAQSGGTPPPTSNDQSSVPAGSLPSRIEDTKRRLTQLQNKYTDNHPDVIATKSELEKLMAQTHTSDDNEAHEKITSFPETETDRQVLGLNLAIKTLKNEDAMIKAKIDEYQTKVEMAPKLEQQLSLLTRDYENTKKAYDELTGKCMAAEQAEKMEINQQGEQFKVLDLAKMPIKPFKPNQINILLMGFLIALGLSGGLVLLVEQLDQSFYSTHDLETYLGLPVLASIPLVEAQESKKISLRYFLRYLPTPKRT